MIGRLLRAESIKLRGRSAFSIAVLSFTGFLAFLLAARVYAAREERFNQTFATPGIWTELNDQITQMVVFFSLVTLINLIAAEYPWKTSRQNVIDGLSRDQWFFAKLLLLPLVTLLFFVLAYTLIGVAVIGFADRTGPLITAAQMKSIGSILIASIGFSSLALFFSFLTRSAGGAMASVFGFFVAEGLITLSMSRINPDWERYGSYLPVRTFGSLAEPIRWDPALAAVARLREPMVDTQILLVLTTLYVAVLWGASYLLVRKRDL